MEQKFAAIFGAAQSGVSVTQVCAEAGISRQTYYRYRRRVPDDESSVMILVRPRSRCVDASPNTEVKFVIGVRPSPRGCQARTRTGSCCRSPRPAPSWRPRCPPAKLPRPSGRSPRHSHRRPDRGRPIGRWVSAPTWSWATGRAGPAGHRTPTPTRSSTSSRATPRRRVRLSQRRPPIPASRVGGRARRAKFHPSIDGTP